jgi:hypothetical protein
MGAEAILVIINGLLGTVMNIWTSARQILGEEAIPEWDELTKANAITQAKIDAEKK